MWHILCLADEQICNLMFCASRCDLAEVLSNSYTLESSVWHVLFGMFSYRVEISGQQAIHIVYWGDPWSKGLIQEEASAMKKGLTDGGNLGVFAVTQWLQYEVSAADGESRRWWGVFGITLGEWWSWGNLENSVRTLSEEWYVSSIAFAWCPRSNMWWLSKNSYQCVKSCRPFSARCN